MPLINVICSSRPQCRTIGGPRLSLKGSRGLAKEGEERLSTDHQSIMHLMYYLDDAGKRVYTLKKEAPSGEITYSAHPARFSPDDKFSKQRITLKKRFNLLPTQQGERVL